MGLDPFDCSVHLGDLAQPAILTIKNVQREVTYIRVAQVDGWQCRFAVDSTGRGSGTHSFLSCKKRIPVKYLNGEDLAQMPEPS